MQAMLGNKNENSVKCAPRDELLRKITMLDFMAVDLQLYLDTHPTDGDALEMYNDCVTASQAIREKYELEYGPLVGFRSEGQRCGKTGGWAWINCPWPWQSGFNFPVN